MSHLVCKGVCHRYHATRPGRGNRYAMGQRRCQACEIFMSWEGIWCPCCKGRLRTKPRNKNRIAAVVNESVGEAIGTAAKIALIHRKVS